MVNKFSLLALGAMLGFGAMTLTDASASAAALPFSPLASGQENSISNGIIQVAQGKKDRRMRSEWEYRRDGRRCSRRSDNCRHFHDGHYYETPWWTLPLITSFDASCLKLKDFFKTQGNFDCSLFSSTPGFSAA